MANSFSLVVVVVVVDHRFSQDCNEYTRVILDTLQTEVPKSVVHCMVRRAKEQMLAKLYSHITSLQPWEVSTIMEEDHTVVQRRAATTNAIKELEAAVLGTEKIMVCVRFFGGISAIQCHHHHATCCTGFGAQKGWQRVDANQVCRHG